jgi:hypothetical protein
MLLGKSTLLGWRRQIASGRTLRRSNRLGPRGSGLQVVAGGGSRLSFDHREAHQHMKWTIATVAAVLGLILTWAWCTLSFKIGPLEYSTPMSMDSLILVRAGTDDRLAAHLRGVTDYVTKLGPSLRLESHTREERPPLSRFLPWPHASGCPYHVRVTFSDQRGDRYTVIFSGEIGFDARGISSPQYVTGKAKECVDDFISTVFAQAPEMAHRLLRREGDGRTIESSQPP